ncbi:MAG: M1 family metallopeptidase [Acidobacteriota bacterium]
MIRAWFAAFATLAWVASYAVDMTWNRAIQKGSSPDLLKSYRFLTEPQPLAREAIEGLTIARPAFKASLGPGTLFGEDRSTGQPGGLYFEGDARIDFSVSDPVEREHLKMFIGREALSGQPVESLFILPLGPCPDLPLPGVGGYSMEGQADYRRYKNAFHAGGMSWLDTVLNRALHGEGDVAVLFRMDGDVWAYVLDSNETEEVSLRRLGHPPHVEAWWWDAAVSLHRNAAGALTPLQTPSEVGAKFPADVRRIEASMVLDGSCEAMDGTLVRIHMKLLRPVRSLLFTCSPRLEISRLNLAGGAEVPFIKEAFSKKDFYHESHLLVGLPEGTPEDLTLEVRYTAELCFSEFGIVALHDDSGWFPSLSDADGFTFGFSADVPKNYECLGVGDLTDHRVQGEREVFTYDMPEKVRLASFLFGKFKHSKRTAAGIEVDVALPDNANTTYITRNRDEVADEIADALERYTKMFGPIPYKTLKAGLTSGYTNLGFPSMIMLSYGVFNRSGSSWPEQVVAHEVAHQWWYNQVAPLTYRDAWISESMAEYASLVCLRERSGMDTMKKYLSHDFHTFTKLSDVLKKPYISFGPISLGPRLYTTLDPDSAYGAVVYYKGAWTLLNLSKMACFTPGGEGSFNEALKDLVTHSKGKLLSTRDVQEAFERHLKVQLGWYFNQWLHSSVLPKVKVTTKVEGDKLVVQGSQDSKLTLPIPIQTAEGKKKVREYLFFLKPEGSRQEFPLAFKPDLVLVDTNRTCLADYQ